MEMLSRTYGWTPQQIRNMDVRDVDSYLDIIKTRNALLRAQQMKNKHGRI